MFSILKCPSAKIRLRNRCRWPIREIGSLGYTVITLVATGWNRDIVQLKMC